MANAPRVTAASRPPVWLVSIAPSVMAVWIAELFRLAADAGSTSMDTAMHAASRHARRRFFIGVFPFLDVWLPL